MPHKPPKKPTKNITYRSCVITFQLEIVILTSSYQAFQQAALSPATFTHLINYWCSIVMLKCDGPAMTAKKERKKVSEPSRLATPSQMPKAFHLLTLSLRFYPVSSTSVQVSFSATFLILARCIYLTYSLRVSSSILIIGLISM